MDGSGTEADVFAIPKFQQTSQWLEHLDKQPSTLFFSRELDTCEEQNLGLFSLGPVAAEDGGFFKLPVTATKKGEGPAPEAIDHACSDAETTSDNDISVELWTHLNNSPGRKRLYRTWDDFLSQDHRAPQPAFVSEAGPNVYDALLSDAGDPLGFANTEFPVVQTEAYFSSLLALALGYESTLFMKNSQTLHFKPVFPNMRISGFSRDVLQHVENQCLTCGSTFLSLRAFLHSTYTSRTTRCGVALASAIAEVLRAVQEHVATEQKSPRSLLQLQATVRGIMIVLDPFRALTTLLRGHVPDEDLVMHVFQQASSADFNDDSCPEIMREVLQRVSRPWIEFMEEWIGTRREEGMPLAKSNLGQAKGFIKVEAQTYVDDFGEEIEEVGFRMDENKIPKFLPDELAESIFEIGRNLRFIRSCHPDTALAQWEVIESTQPPKVAWLYNWEQIAQLESRVASYRDSLASAVQQYRTSAQEFRGTVSPLLKADSNKPLGLFGVEKDQIEEQLLASMKELNQPVSHFAREDSLERMVQRRLLVTHGVDAADARSTPRWSLLPILSFGGIVSAQARVVNRESLRLLFENHDLRKHLRLQRDFQMLGNGNFCSRLSHALFDPEMETAERQRGTARTGAVMGLRLGGRETWPPASSELRLALMGVLAEAHNLQIGSSTEGQHVGSSDLPGDLSFAVRDLPPDEIDRCMNPDSLEALDFLRLSYKAPAALTSIITPVTLMQYDRIFKHLLRLLRMLYVVNQLFRDITGRGSWGNNPSNISRRFAFEAHHFVCGISTYFMDTGVAIPWQKFEERLAEVESDLTRPTTDAAPGKLDSPDRLQDYHLHVLDQVMRTLFLKKRQQPILKLLDEVFRVVLLFVKQTRLQILGGVHDSTGINGGTQLYREFRQKVQLFMTVCRGLTEKSHASNRKKEREDWVEDEGMGDESKIAQLLVKLDMAGYYSKR